MGGNNLYAGFQEKKFFKTPKSLRYTEDSFTFFEVTIHTSKTDEFSDIAYLSWLEGKGSGVRLFGYILSKLIRRSKDTGRAVYLFMEPTTLEGQRFLDKLVKLGFKFEAEDSQINTGSRGYSLEVNSDTLNILAVEA